MLCVHARKHTLNEMDRNLSTEVKEVSVGD